MKAPRGFRWIGLAGAACVALSPPTGSAQTAETFKSGGPVPYTTYLKRTGQTGPKSRAKATRPKSRATTTPPASSASTAPAPPASTPNPTAVLGAPARPASPSVAPPRPTPASPAAPPPPPRSAATPPLARPSAIPPALPDAAPSAATPAAGLGARLAPTAAIPPAELEAFVDGAVRQAMAADRVAGAAVVVVQDGQPVLEKGYGLARLQPATPVDPHRTLFRLGSVSKVLTWIEVLKQIDAGRLSPDTPIDDALPEDLRIGLQGFRTPVRLRHLMTHTGGFESREFGRLFQADPRRLRGLNPALRTEGSRRVREAGRLTSYSSYGAALAGAAASAVAHAPFDRLMEDDLLKPAGLDSTSFREPYPADADLPEPLPAALADRLSVGFHHRRGGLAPAAFSFGQDFAPAVSASASPHDMGRLMALMLGAPGAPWSPRVAAALFTPLPALTPGLPGWTYALQQQPLAGGFAGFGHGGATPAFRSRLLIVPQLRLGVFVVANTDSAAALADRLPQALVARFYAPAPVTVGRPDPTIDAGRYAGLYLTSRRAYHGLEGLVDRLTRTERVSVGPDGRLVVGDADGGVREYVPVAGSDGRFVSPEGLRPIAFPADPNHPGAPARLLVDPGRAEGAVREGWIHEPAVLAVGALVAAFAALLCLAGLGLRDWREDRQTPSQALASAVQTLAALAWLLAIGGFLVFWRRLRDPAALVGHWPNAWLVGASWAALAAALLGLVQLVQLRDVWADRRRVQGWKPGRKLRHTLTTLVFLVFSVVLAAWGGLEPWSS